MVKTNLLTALLICGMGCAPQAMAQAQMQMSLPSVAGSIGNVVSTIANTASQPTAVPSTSGGSMRNGLPPTSMDSFVNQSAYMQELIYGDEGTTDIPPYFEFDPSHRINSGIFGTRNAGLTTGHGSWMPDAWGYDEFTGNEWSQSGATGQANSPPPGVNVNLGPAGTLNVGPNGADLQGNGYNVGVGTNGSIMGSINPGAVPVPSGSPF